LPRNYRLGRRAEQMSKTRERIVRATLELVRAEGLRATTVPAIAKAADVAQATVRNHFPDEPALLNEVGTMILDDLAVPDTDIFDGLDTPSERVTRLARELVAFYGRGQDWWFVLTADPSMTPAFQQTARVYEERFDRLVEEAVRPIGDDALAVAMVGSVVGPPLHYALVARGFAPDDVVETSLAMLLPWLESRGSKDRRPKPRQTPGARTDD
jgi:AcrR family transcriptional regulator